MARTAILAVKIIGDASGAAKALNQAGANADTMGKRMQGASRVAKVALLAIAAGAVSAARAAAQDEKSQALLAQTMQKNAGATKAQVAATEAWINAQSRAKGVADDELRPALAGLVRATGDTATSQKALQVAMDVSAATGKPLSSVSAALSKAYAGNTTSLGRLVPGLDKATLASGDMTKIMAMLADKTGGAATTAANTAAGKYERMKVVMGELQETVGAALLPAMAALAGVMGQVATFAEQHSTAFTIIIGILAGLAVATIAVNAAYTAWNAITRAITVATKIATVAQKAFNLALRLNPIGLIITAVVLLIAGFVLLYKKSDTFRTLVQAVGKAGQAAIGWIVDKAILLWQKIQLLGPVAKVAKDLIVGYFKLITKPIEVVIDLVKDLIGWIKNIKFPSVPKAISSLGKGGPPVAYAGGGASRVAYSTLPGRGGPGSGGFVSSFVGRGNGMLVNINVSGALDPDAVARQIEDLLAGRGRRLGRYTR